MIVAFDTSTKKITIALKKDHSIYTITYSGKEKHAVKLAPIFYHLLKSAGTSLNETELIGLGIGPGSLTGLRIGIGFALGVASTLGIKIVPLNSLHLIAKNIAWDGEIVVVRKARQGWVYFQIFSKDHLPLSEPLVMSVRNAGEKIKQLSNPILVGDGKELFQGARASHHLDFPIPEVLIDATLEHAEEASQFFEIEPLYLQKSIAEINWERRRRDEKGV